MREARRSTRFKYGTWILAMQRSWVLISIRMNQSFYRGKSLPIRQEAARQPVNFWTSRRHLGNLMFSIARILVGLASIPRLDTRKPSNLPAGTPNVHLSGLSFSRNFRSFANVSLRSSNKVCFSLVLMTMSSTYTCTFLDRKSVV